MALTDILGSLGRTTTQQLPGIIDRDRQSQSRQANAAFGKAFHQALQSGDEAAMNSAIQQFSGQADQQVIQKASEAVSSFKSDAREQRVQQLTTRPA